MVLIMRAMLTVGQSTRSTTAEPGQVNSLLFSRSATHTLTEAPSEPHPRLPQFSVKPSKRLCSSPCGDCIRRACWCVCVGLFGLCGYVQGAEALLCGHAA